MVPFPAQGSINPLLNLAYLLSFRGVFITFVDMENSSYKPMSRAAAAATLTFRFLTIPDASFDLREYILALENNGPVFEHYLLRSLSDGSPPITYIVSENFMPCNHQVANNLGVPRVIFWTLCAASSIAQCNANFLVSRGHIPIRVEDLKKADREITCLPGNLPPILPSDLLSVYRAADPSDVVYRTILRQSEIQNKADYVLVNTFDELESPESVGALSCNGCPALAVGPVFLPNFLERRDVNGLASMFEQEEICLTWLDAKETASVIYVSFGSIAVKSNAQLEELAVGLAKSQQPFLWVLRTDVAEGGDVCFMTHQTVEQNTKISYPLLNKVLCMLRLLDDHTMTSRFL